ncbi:hypothetical protein [Lacticaseibacillus parakribbianus]|uniref:hypothetical protein n=1 Tax=Lacticaseibacillus parakribbianus TaxID=2970927 RepID=UPI0021CB3D53|nr:hypothetical protein [Lacticaseibacillus parakribbianus]
MEEDIRAREGRNAGKQLHHHESVEQVQTTVDNDSKPVEPVPEPPSSDSAEQQSTASDPKAQRTRPTSTNAKFSFDTAEYIISANSIPDGFVFLKPAYYAYSATMTFGSIFGNAGNGYAKAYSAVLSSIQDEIDKGEYDALFNMRVITKDTSDSTEYDCVIYGDACIVAE